MKFYYTSERHYQIVIYLLKQYGIRKVIASPGTTNISLVASLQQDSYFEMFSAADERSAAYMACGIASESGEPVVLSCTGATASRNYLPGLTEAYYRKLPVLAITSTSNINKVGNLLPQCIDRSQIQKDVAIISVHIHPIHSIKEENEVTLFVNKALNALFSEGGGPVHINIESGMSMDFNVQQLPSARVIRQFSEHGILPPLPKGRIAVFVGAHKPFSEKETALIDQFCGENDAVVFCDHTSSYKGKYRFLCALLGTQSYYKSRLFFASLVIHIGEVSGNYPCLQLLIKAKEVWRVSEDGQMSDFSDHLSSVFHMPEAVFFNNYLRHDGVKMTNYLNLCHQETEQIAACIPKDLPFSNIWIAQQIAPRIPKESTLHLGILNSLRSWNFFELPASVTTSCNVGGFGIDGCVSTLIGASLTNPSKLYYGIFGDLAFFYDMNVLLNRHVGHNLRIMLINNGKGTEFCMYSHFAQVIGDAAETFVAAAGHYGNKSKNLIRHYAEDAGFTYLCASDKQNFMNLYEQYVNPEISKSILFEVFIDSKDESDALFQIDHLVEPDKNIKSRAITVAKSVIKSVLGKSGLEKVKHIIK